MFSPSDAVRLAEARGLGMWEMGEWVAKSKYIKKEMICLPRLSVKEVEGEITQVTCRKNNKELSEH